MISSKVQPARKLISLIWIFAHNIPATVNVRIHDFILALLNSEAGLMIFASYCVAHILHKRIKLLSRDLNNGTFSPEVAFKVATLFGRNYWLFVSRYSLHHIFQNIVHCMGNCWKKRQTSSFSVCIRLLPTTGCALHTIVSYR